MGLLNKLFIVLTIVLFAVTAQAWTLTWQDVTGEDGYIIKYKDYPTGYSYPANPAPEVDIEDMTGATSVPLAADVVEWDLPEASFAEGSRYVFAIQATLEGSVSGFSDFLCWTYPAPGDVVELEVESGSGIQINIMQKP